MFYPWAWKYCPLCDRYKRRYYCPAFSNVLYIYYWSVGGPLMLIWPDLAFYQKKTLWNIEWHQAFFGQIVFFVRMQMEIRKWISNRITPNKNNDLPSTQLLWRYNARMYTTWKRESLKFFLRLKSAPLPPRIRCGLLLQIHCIFVLYCFPKCFGYCTLWALVLAWKFDTQ